MKRDSFRAIRLSANRTSQKTPEWSRPRCPLRPKFASNCVQNSGFYREFWGWEARKLNCINRVYGAGDGNRSHVRSLG